MADLEDPKWLPWIEEISALLEIDPGEVDVVAIHHLTRQVAHRFDRAMAPVAAYMVALAHSQNGGSAQEYMDRIEAVLPPLPPSE